MNEITMYDQSLASLNEIYETMMSPEYDLSLAKQPDDVKIRAGYQLFEVQKKRTDLENKKIDAIINAFDENAAALKAGISQVQQTKQNLDNITAFLNAVSALVGIIAGIMKYF